MKRFQINIYYIAKNKKPWIVDLNGKQCESCHNDVYSSGREVNFLQCYKCGRIVEQFRQFKTITEVDQCVKED